MIVRLHRPTLSFLAPHPSRGVLASSMQLLVPLPMPNIALLLLLHMKFVGFIIFFRISVCHSLQHYSFYMTIWEQLDLPLIRFFTPVWSTSSLTFTLFVTWSPKSVLSIAYVNTLDQLADVLTKPLAKARFIDLRSKNCRCRWHVTFAGAYLEWSHYVWFMCLRWWPWLPQFLIERLSWL